MKAVTEKAMTSERSMVEFDRDKRVRQAGLRLAVNSESSHSACVSHSVGEGIRARGSEARGLALVRLRLRVMVREEQGESDG
jgi:hypothetical protein